MPTIKQKNLKRQHHGKDSQKISKEIPTTDSGSGLQHAANVQIDDATPQIQHDNLFQAELSVDSDDEHPDPRALAQFFESRTDFLTPFSIQREKLWEEKTRLSK